MTDIVVEVRKGMVTGLYCDIEDARFVVVDWDLLERLDSGTQVAVEQDHASLRSLDPNTRSEYQQVISQ
jgi:hypothetical protein